MAEPVNAERLERFNLVLSLGDIAWLDQLAAEIRAESGAKVSRSEMVRAALAGLRELHRLAPLCPTLALHTVRSGSDLTVLAVLSARVAAIPDGR
jgi:hypothetical protein